MTPLVAITCVVALASLVQSVAGSGFGLLAAPLLVVVAPDLVPGALLSVTPLVMLGSLHRDRAGLRPPDLFAPAVLGVLGALAVVPVTPLLHPTFVALVTGALVVGAAALALRGARVPQHAWTLPVAGAAGGVLATVAAVPGPPVVIAYRCTDPVRLRANLSLYFLMVCSTSAAVLALSGQLDGSDLRGATLLLPGLLLGMAGGYVARGYLRAEGIARLSLYLAMAAGALLFSRGLVAVMG